MKEYRVRAYFHGDVYKPRSFKRRVVYTREEAEEIAEVAEKYYSGRYTYGGYFDRVVIEEREVSEWKESIDGKDNE